MFDLIFPLLLIILGVIYRVNPPKNKESRFSYRTKASLKNEISWQKSASISRNLLDSYRGFSSSFVTCTCFYPDACLYS